MNDIAPLDYPLVSSEALETDPTQETIWLWQDFLARGMITLLTSRWKAGKTTLLSVLLAKIAGGGDLAASFVAPSQAVVVSEEPRALWAERRRRLSYGSHIRWLCRPFAGRPTMAQWTALIDQLAGVRAELVVIDPLAMVLPGDVENSASRLLEAIEPLHRITDRGAAVLVLHHPRKNSPADELSPRGSGALTGFADVLADLDLPANAAVQDRRRRLRVVSRSASRRNIIIELNAAGTDYSLPSPPEIDEFTRGWPMVRMVLEDASQRLTRKGILAEWPDDFDRPAMQTLWAWLDRATQLGLVERSGDGRKYAPFRYKLPGQIDLFEELAPLEPMRMPFANEQAEEKPRKGRRKKREAGEGNEGSRPVNDAARRGVADFKGGAYSGD